MSTGTGTGQMSEAIYKSDLIRIRKEVGHPIAILFDECNVLSQNRVLLEMVRNIFMNTSGFMLVFTGTADLFPIMDEVFSPIVRQFKKIDIDPFQELDETKACIQKPLESIGVEDPGELFEFGDMGQVRDVHDLTGGRPYEIQLLCHFLFRRVQMGQARTMRLDVAVLDDVLRELRRGRDMSSRPTITRIRNYQRSQLNALNFLVPCSGHATFDQLWFTAHVFQGRELADRTRLAGHLAHMSKDQVLDIQNGIITFRGDDFDKIYSKYFARQRKVFLAFPDFPLEVSFSLSMRRGCQSQLGLEFLGGMAQVGTLPASYTADASDIVYQLPDVAELNRILDTYPVDVTCDLYWALLKFARIKEGKIDLVSISVTTPFLVVSLPFVRVTVSEQGPDDLASHLEAMACRAQSLGGEVTWDIKRGVQMPTVETLARCVAATGNEELRQAICSRHTVELKREYIEKHNMESVAFHSSLISRYNPALSDSQANNLAYIHMARGEYEEAKALLLRALSQIAASEQGKSALPRPWYGEVHVPGLALFNLGVVELKLGNAKKAYELFQQVKETWNENKPKHGDILCLFIPTIGEGELELIEKKRPSASESIDKALEVAGILAQE
jgi:tetratricopeptide (TPR) repeat protein